jgi:hypothetical protein
LNSSSPVRSPHYPTNFSKTNLRPLESNIELKKAEKDLMINKILKYQKIIQKKILFLGRAFSSTGGTL